jgi:large-conductance mechanosensitive channel
MHGEDARLREQPASRRARERHATEEEVVEDEQLVLLREIRDALKARNEG